MPEWFIINDIKEFTDKARSIVFNNFGKWSEHADDILTETLSQEDQNEMDDVLSHKESLVIVKSLIKKQKHKQTNDIRYILNDNIFADIVQMLNDRMVSNLLHNLSTKGLIESAFDNETNDFIFWIKNEENHTDEQPETD